MPKRREPWNAQPGRLSFPTLEGKPPVVPEPMGMTAGLGPSAGTQVDRCPECGSASKGSYHGKLCDDPWHTRPRPGEVLMASVGLHPVSGDQVWVRGTIVECPDEGVVLVRIPSLGPIKVMPIRRSDIFTQPPPATTEQEEPVDPDRNTSG